MKDEYYIEFAFYNLAILYTQEKDFKKAVEYSFKLLDLDRQMNDELGIINALQNIGIAYSEMGKLDSANSVQAISLLHFSNQQESLIAHLNT